MSPAYGSHSCPALCFEVYLELRPAEMDEHGAWERLWELVAPVEKDVEKAREPTGPTMSVNIPADGPWALYEFDGLYTTDDAGFLTRNLGIRD